MMPTLQFFNVGSWAALMIALRLGLGCINPTRKRVQL